MALIAMAIQYSNDIIWAWSKATKQNMIKGSK